MAKRNEQLKFLEFQSFSNQRKGCFFTNLGAIERVILFSTSASFFLALTIPLPPLF